MSKLTSTMIMLMTIIIVGYIGGKIGIINENCNKNFSTLMLYITMPFLIISSISSGEVNVSINIFQVILIGIVMYILLIIIARIYVKIVPLSSWEKPVHEVAMIFGNISFVGYPVFSAVLGKSAIFVSTMLNLPFNILLFSYSVYLFSKDESREKLSLKEILNPGFISAILALMIYFSGFKIPKILNDAFTSIGGITIPLSMLLIGSSLATIKTDNLIREYKVLIYSLAKLIVLPIITFFIAKGIGLNEYIIKLLALNVACPAASIVIMLANQYNKSIRTASITIFVSTLLSVITIPLLEKFLFPLI